MVRGLTVLSAHTPWLCCAETVLALMRNPEYSIYGAAKVDNEGGLDAGEDRFNQVRALEHCLGVSPLVSHGHCRCVQAVSQHHDCAGILDSASFDVSRPLAVQICNC